MSNKAKLTSHNRLNRMPHFRSAAAVKVAAFILILIFIPGCATYQPKPMNLDNTAKRLEARTLTNRGLKIFIEKTLQRKILPWPLKSWDLNMLMISARYYNPNIKIALSKFKIAKASEITAAQFPNPIIVPQFQYNPLPNKGETPLSYGIEELWLPFETAGRRGYKIKIAKRKAQSMIFNTVSSSWKTYGRLMNSLINIHYAKQQINLLRKIIYYRKNLVKILKYSLAVGEVPQTDVLKAKTSTANALIFLNDARRYEDDSYAVLASAIGVRVKAVREININFNWLEGLSFNKNLINSSLKEKALTDRADILESLNNYKAQESTLQLEVARQYPNIDIGPGVLWNSGVAVWSFLLKLTLPIFNQNNGPIAVAKAKLNLEEKNIKNIQLRVIDKLSQAESNYLVSVRKLKTSKALLAYHKKQLKITEKEFITGEIGRQGLVLSHIGYLFAKLSDIKAITNLQRSFVTLELTVQQPLMKSLPVSPVLILNKNLRRNNR